MAGSNTQQTWRQEDFQENCLAEELQSGLYLSDQVFSSDSMKEIIQSLISDEGMTDPFCSGGQPHDRNDLPTSFTDLLENQTPLQTSTDLHRSPQTHCTTNPHHVIGGINCILKLPTACTLKTEETTVTYLNRGQTYMLTLSSNMQQIYQSALFVEFHDLRLRNYEKEHLTEWMQFHPNERLVTIEKTSCHNVYDISHNDLINRVEFSWNSSHEAVVAFSINCLSSEFTQKKHGGEKGVLLRLILTNNVNGAVASVQSLYCLVKVFKDKGADRKHKQDMQKREKLPLDEAEKVWESKPYTLFETLHINSPVRQNKEANISIDYNTVFSPGSNITSPQSRSDLSQWIADCTSPQINSALCSPMTRSLSQLCMTSCTDVNETRQWLINNRFTSFTSLFSNFSGSDFLRLSRKDLMDICGPADGIRMFNALHSHALKRIYICLESESVYHGIFLEAMTADHFKEMVSSKLSVSSTVISSVLIQPTPGILVNIDDLCVENMGDEQCFIVQAIKEEQHNTVQLILRPFANS